MKASLHVALSTLASVAAATTVFEDPNPVKFAAPALPLPPTTNVPPRRSGLYIDPSTCGKKVRLVRGAIDDLNMLATAGLNAVSEPLVHIPSNPAFYFFNTTTYDTVRQVFADAINYSLARQFSPLGQTNDGGGFDRGDPIRVSCGDQDVRCEPWDLKTTPPLAFPSARTTTQDATILLCPRFFRLNGWQLPCSKISRENQFNVGATTRGLYLLALFLQVHNRIGGAAHGTRQCHDLLRPDAPTAPLFHPECFARLASWAFDLNMLHVDVRYWRDGSVLAPEETCMEKFGQALAVTETLVGEWPLGKKVARPTQSEGSIWAVAGDKRKRPGTAVGRQRGPGVGVPLFGASGF